MAEDWECVYYQSGTCVVKDRSAPHVEFQYGTRCLEPWFYIYGPQGANDSETARNRYKVCEDIRDYMNGGPRPAWLDDLNRTTESYAEDLDGTKILTTGPMVDGNPPACDWVQDESQDAKDARARLMDRLLRPAITESN